MQIEDQLRGAKVVLDTNALGALVKDRSFTEISVIAKAINLHKKKLDYYFVLDITVCNELLRHLKSMSGKDYERCKKSICLLGKIASEQGKIKYNPSWTTQLCFFIQGQNLISIQKYDESIIKIMQWLFRFNLDDDAVVSMGREFYYNSELNWIQNRDDIINSIVQAIETDAEIDSSDELIIKSQNRTKILKKTQTEDYATALIMSLLLQIHKFHQQLNSIRVLFRFKMLKLQLAPATYFFKEFWKNLINGLSQRKNKIAIDRNSERWNSISDFFIILSSKLSDSVLVSQDGQIVKAFVESGHQSQIISINDYLKSIEL